jgi:hypothetical protein
LRLVRVIEDLAVDESMVPHTVPCGNGSPAMIVPSEARLAVMLKLVSPDTTTLNGSQGLTAPLLLGSPL